MELEWNLILPSLFFTLSNQYWKGIRISKTYRSQLKNYYDSRQCPLIEKNCLCSRFRDKWWEVIPTFLWIHSNFESICSDCKVVRFSSKSIQGSYSLWRQGSAWRLLKIKSQGNRLVPICLLSGGVYRGIYVPSISLYEFRNFCYLLLAYNLLNK